MTTDSERIMSAIVAELERAWNAGDGVGSEPPGGQEIDMARVAVRYCAY